MEFNSKKNSGFTLIDKGMSQMPPAAQVNIPTPDGSPKLVYNKELTVEGSVVEPALTSAVATVKELPKATESGIRAGSQWLKEQVAVVTESQIVKDAKTLGEDGLKKAQEAKQESLSWYAAKKKALGTWVQKINCSFLSKNDAKPEAQPPAKPETKGGARKIEEPAPTITQNVYGETRVLALDKAGNSITTTSSEGNKTILFQHGSGTYLKMEDGGGTLDKTRDRKLTIIDKNWEISIGEDEIKLVSGDQVVNIKKTVLTNIEEDENHNVDGERSIKVGQNQLHDIGKNDTTTVGADRTLSVAGKEEIKVGGDSTTTIMGGETRTINTQLTITVNGPISVNCMSADITALSMAKVKSPIIRLLGRIMMN